MNQLANKYAEVPKSVQFNTNKAPLTVNEKSVEEVKPIKEEIKAVDTTNAVLNEKVEGLVDVSSMNAEKLVAMSSVVNELSKSVLDLSGIVGQLKNEMNLQTRQMGLSKNSQRMQADANIRLETEIRVGKEAQGVSPLIRKKNKIPRSKFFSERTQLMHSKFSSGHLNHAPQSAFGPLKRPYNKPAPKNEPSRMLDPIPKSAFFMRFKEESPIEMEKFDVQQAKVTVSSIAQELDRVQQILDSM